jgi:hypothetical protein
MTLKEHQHKMWQLLNVANAPKIAIDSPKFMLEKIPSIKPENCCDHTDE